MFHTNDEPNWNFRSPSYIPSLTAYSGDMTNLSRATRHKITKLSVVASKFTIVKLCPHLSQYSAISLIESDNFNYATNTTGTLVYVKVSNQVEFAYFKR